LILKNVSFRKILPMQIRLAVKKYAVDNGLDFFDVRNHEGFLRTLMMRQNSKGEWMVLFQLVQRRKRKQRKAFAFLLEKFPQIKTLVYAINPKAK
jgi:23S rRNA (uracil1939-C5)-methyltransferase